MAYTLKKILPVFLTVICFSVYGQASDTIPSDNSTLHAVKYSTKVLDKMQQYEKQLTGKTEKTLTKLSRWEEKIRAILKKADPQAEARLFGNDRMTFATLLRQLQSGEAALTNYQTQYNAYLDTLSTNLQYLKEATPGNDAIEKAGLQLPRLKSSMAQADYTAQFIKERKAQLAKEAGKYVQQKLLTKISKEDYYFGEALTHYKELFSDKTKAEALVTTALAQLPAFQKFMQEHSELSSLFRLPGSSSGGNSTAALAGLQTRASVQSMIQQRVAAGGPSGAAQVQQNLREAQTRLTEMKDKLLKGGVIGCGGAVEMPDFKPNGQHTKSFLQRIEYGFDVQFARSNGYLPSATDIAVSIGYKLNDKSVIGVGLSYKMGIGSIERIRLTSEGIGLRSYADWKIKGQWYATGGYEMNYQSSFKSIPALKDAMWQRSALVGINRQYKVSKKLKGEVKMQYDFMADRQVPAGVPFVFRVGYKM